jgi:hypothetical protein
MTRALLLLLACLCAVPTGLLGQEAPAPGADVAAGVKQVQEGDFEGAIATLEAAAARLRGDPTSVRLLVQADIQLGVAHVALDHTAQAVQSFAEALALDPNLRLGADRFSPKVLRAFETAREQSARRTATPSGGSSSHRKAWLVGGGVAVAAGAVAVATRGGGNGPAFSGARFGTPVRVCENGSDNVPLPFIILVEANNPSGAPVAIKSATAVVTIVSATVTSEVGFASSRETLVTPSSIPAKQSVTLSVQSSLVCGNGFGDEPRFNEWSGRVTLTTADGVFMIDVGDRMRVNIP